jgi:hypothetical protein
MATLEQELRDPVALEIAWGRLQALTDEAEAIDWNIFARINRPYLKQFHMEEEMHVVLLVDASTSMTFEGKLDLALRLAAGFGVVGLRGSEKVSAYVAGNGGAAFLRPCSGRAATSKLFGFLENVPRGGDQAIDVGIESMLRKHRGRGVVIVLSDFLTTGDLRRGFNLVFNAGLEIFGLQILGPTEIAPEITGDFRLVDSELESTLDISNTGDLLALYHEYRATQEAQLAAFCQQRSGRFLSISAADPFERVFFETLRRKGWVL